MNSNDITSVQHTKRLVVTQVRGDVCALFVIRNAIERKLQRRYREVIIIYYIISLWAKKKKYLEQIWPIRTHVVLTRL